MSDIVQRLADFADALDGADPPGDATCEICGRTGRKTWRTTLVNTKTRKVHGQVSLCGPCMVENLEATLEGMG